MSELTPWEERRRDKRLKRALERLGQRDRKPRFRPRNGRKGTRR